MLVALFVHPAVFPACLRVRRKTLVLPCQRVFFFLDAHNRAVGQLSCEDGGALPVVHELPLVTTSARAVMLAGLP